MRRILLFMAAAGVFSFCFLGQQTAQAHTLKIDGSMGVTVHISPDDAPVAGQDSQIMLSVLDRNSNFKSFEDCDCVIDIEKQGERIDSFSVSGVGLSTVSTLVFPSSGLYKLQISGTPKDDAVFDAFNVTFTYNIGGSVPSGVTKTTSNALKTYVPFVIVGVISFLLLLFLIPGKRKQPL